MTVDSLNQVYNLAIALILGVGLGVIYDIFKLVRLLGINFKVAVFVEDILFFLISTIAIFSFYMQFTDGKFRIYPFLAAVVGFAVYFKTVEKLIFWIIKKVYFFVTGVLHFVYRKIVRPPLKFIKKLLFKTFSEINRFFYNFFGQNIIKFLKNLLPKKRKMLYNSERTKKVLKRRDNGGKRFFY